MLTDFYLFEPAYDFVDGQISAILGDRIAAVAAEIAGPLRISLVLYILLYGFAILRGSIAEPIMDFALRSIKLVFIYTIATTPAYGNYVTQPLFTNLPNSLAQAVSGSSTATVGQAFDELINDAAYLAERASDKGSIGDVGPWIVGAIILVVGALAAALGFGVVMVAKIGLALLVTIGPIFVALALFDATRRYFFGWLAQGVNYLVLFALILTVVQLVLDLVRSQWSTIEGLDPVAGGYVFIALCILAGFFFLHIPTLAAGVAGGASAGIADFANAASRIGTGKVKDPIASQKGQGSSENAKGGKS